ncbi:YunC family protein [Paenibacillus sp. D51F]
MMQIVPVALGDGKTALGIEVKLPKTTLLAVTTDKGYIMCGALDVALFDSNPKLKERGVVAARAVGVRTLEELLDAPLESVTEAAGEAGLYVGMKGIEAVRQLA